MSKIMISELTETTSAPDSSYIAIDNGTTTNKITVANYNTNANATAKSYAEAAQGYANDSLTAKNDAVSAKTEVETLVGTASDYANAASTSASAAAGSASEASGYVGAAQASASNALASARAAEASAANVEGYVNLSKSWAQGNTGARAGENTNNAKYWSEVAMAAAGGGVITFNGRTGAVLPEAGDYSSDEIAHVNRDSTPSNVETEINNLQTSRLKTYAADDTQWDTAPTENSTKPVTSGGVYTAINTLSASTEENFEAVDAEISDMNNILGAKNLCPNTATTVVQYGVTYTVNSDGSVTLTGTPTTDNGIELGFASLPAGTYKVSLSNDGTSEVGNRTWLEVQAGSGWSVCLARSNQSDGTSNVFTVGEGGVAVRFILAVRTGGALNIRKYPMCKPASIKDESYVPYVLTNKELSSQIGELNSQFNDFANLPSDLTQIGSTGVYYRIFNRIVEIFISKNNINVSNSGTTIATLPSNVPKPKMEIPWVVPRSVSGDTPTVNGYVATSGVISVVSWAVQNNVRVTGHILYLA